MHEKKKRLLGRFLAVQRKFEQLCRPLTAEEHRVQPIVEVSPPWWTIMHTSWFYARNVLRDRGEYLDDDLKYDVVLNSYYHALGPYLEQGIRGRLSEPTNEQAYAYRSSVQERVQRLIRETGASDFPRLEFLLGIGMNHEEQHIELLLTEIKRIKGENALQLRRPFAISAAACGSESPR